MAGLVSPRAWPQETDQGIAPFTYHAPDSALADLKRRLDETR
jgi:hypothetical protein